MTGNNKNLIIEVVKITPAMAKKWLKKNTHNFRPVTRATVLKYADTMKKGKWVVSDTAISFDPDGNLVNGQHRLNAVIEAGVTVEFIVIRNYTGFMATDNVKKRSFAGYLRHKAEKNAGQLASGLSLLARYLNGGIAVGAGGVHSYEHLFETLENHPRLRESINYCKGKPSIGRLIPPAYVAIVHYLNLDTNRKDVEAFIRDFTRGENLSAKNPAYQLREYLIKEKERRKKGQSMGGGIAQRDKMALLIKAWNLYIMCSDARLSWRPLKETFPEAITEKFGEISTADEFAVTT
jgi:hypothetical protein